LNFLIKIKRKNFLITTVPKPTTMLSEACGFIVKVIHSDAHLGNTTQVTFMNITKNLLCETNMINLIYLNGILLTIIFET
jgi:hypothetical protein